MSRSSGPPAIPVAIVGLGSAGIRHAANFAALGCKVVGIDSDQARHQMLDRIPGAAPAMDIDDAIRQSEAVVVATPASSHLEIASAAATAGRHVLIEKPLSVGLSGTEALEDIVDASGIVAMIGYNLRFLPAVAKAHALISDDAIGRILHGAFEFGYDLRKWNPHRDYRQTYSARLDDGGGVLLDAIHELDLMLLLGGPAESVIATLSSSGTLEIDGEDSVAAVVTTETQGIIRVALDYLAPTYRRGFRLLGSEGSLEWNWNTGTMDFIRGDAAAQFHWTTDIDAAYTEEARYFLDCVASGDRPEASISQGIASLELAMAIRESAASDARVYLAETPDE